MNKQLNVSVLWSVNYLAVEIETPFGQKPNDLPITFEVERMNKQLKMLLLDGAQRTPFYRDFKLRASKRASTMLLDSVFAGHRLEMESEDSETSGGMETDDEE